MDLAGGRAERHRAARFPLGGDAGPGARAALRVDARGSGRCRGGPTCRTTGVAQRAGLRLRSQRLRCAGHAGGHAAVGDVCGRRRGSRGPGGCRDPGADRQGGCAARWRRRPVLPHEAVDARQHPGAAGGDACRPESGLWQRGADLRAGAGEPPADRRNRRHRRAAPAVRRSAGHGADRLPAAHAGSDRERRQPCRDRAAADGLGSRRRGGDGAAGRRDDARRPRGAALRCRSHPARPSPEDGRGDRALRGQRAPAPGVIGALHYFGPEGLLQLLRSRDYVLTRLQ